MDSSKDRWIYGLIAVSIGIAAILAALGIVLTKFSTATDVGAVLGIVTGPIGAIVGAYFGVQVGSAGKEKADENAQNANHLAIQLAATPEGDERNELIRSLR